MLRTAMRASVVISATAFVLIAGGARPCQAQGSFWSSLARAYTDAEAQARQEALYRRHIADLRARRQSDSAATMEMYFAKWRIYSPRASFAIRKALDSLDINGGVRVSFATEAGKALTDLFTVDQEASNAKMVDLLAAITDEYRRALTGFNGRASKVLGAVADSLNLSETDRKTYWIAATVRLLPLRDADLDAPVEVMRFRIQQVVDSVGRSLKKP